MAALRRRLDMLETIGDTEPLFSDDATAEAAAIIEGARGQDDDRARALATAGQLYWRRRLTALADDEVNLHAAMVLFLLPYRHDRTLVPETLWDALAGFDERNVEFSVVSQGIPELCTALGEVVGAGPDALAWLARVFGAAAAMTPAAHPKRPLLTGWLAVVHDRRGEKEHAAALAEEAVPGLLADTAADGWLLSLVGQVIRAHHGPRADPRLLASAVEVSREAERRVADEARPSVLHNLSATLLTRYTARAACGDAGAVDDLVEALDRGREAVTTGTADRPSFLLHAAGYAGALGAWSDRTGDLEVLDEAEYVLRHGLSHAEEDDTQVPYAYFRLGEIAQRRGRDEEALSCYTTASRLLAAGDPLVPVLRDALEGLRAG